MTLNNSGRTFNGDRPYKVRIKTCDFWGAGTGSSVYCRLIGKKGKESDWTDLDISGYNDQERGDDDVYGLTVPADFGPVCAVEFKISGGDAWAVCTVQVQTPDGAVLNVIDHLNSRVTYDGTPRWLSTDADEDALKMMPLSVNTSRMSLYDADGFSACMNEKKRAAYVRVREMAKQDMDELVRKHGREALITGAGLKRTFRAAEDEKGNLTIVEIGKDGSEKVIEWVPADDKPPLMLSPLQVLTMLPQQDQPDNPQEQDQ